MHKQYYVYAMTNIARTLYIGVTNNLEKRVYEHKMKLVPGFTSRYCLTSLAYFEATDCVEVAIQREKQIKGWLRSKKIALIESANPEWKDLSKEWTEPSVILKERATEESVTLGARILRCAQDDIWERDLGTLKSPLIPLFQRGNERRSENNE